MVAGWPLESGQRISNYTVVFLALQTHPEYELDILFHGGHHAKFLVREFVDHILIKGEKVTVSNIPASTQRGLH